jgi:hypothetical protein
MATTFGSSVGGEHERGRLAGARIAWIVHGFGGRADVELITVEGDADMVDRLLPLMPGADRACATAAGSTERVEGTI